MNVQLEIKKMAKSPLSLTAYILVSTLIIVEFVNLFLGRWTSILLMLINITLVVGVWLIFATALMKNKRVSKAGLTCTYAWSLAQLIYQAIVAAIFLLTAIIFIVYGFKTYEGYVQSQVFQPESYWFSASGTSYSIADLLDILSIDETTHLSNAIGVFGILMIIIAVPCQVFMSIYYWMLMKEIKKIEKAVGTGMIQNMDKKIIPFTIVTISMKGFYLLFFTIFGAVTQKALLLLTGLTGCYGHGFTAWLINTIRKALSTPALVVGGIGAAIEIAFIILVLINFIKYNKKIYQVSYR